MMNVYYNNIQVKLFLRERVCRGVGLSYGFDILSPLLTDVSTHLR